MEAKILIIRFTDTKDVLSKTPVLRQVRMAFPDAQIDFLTEQSAEPLLKYNPHLDFLFTVESSRSYKTLWMTRKKIRISSYTHIFDLQKNRFSTFFRLFQPKGKEEIAQSFFPPGTENSFPQKPSREERPEIFWKDTAAKPVHFFLRSKNIRSGYVLTDESTFPFPGQYAELIRELGKYKYQKLLVLGKEKTFGLSKAETEKMIFTKNQFDILEKAIFINMSRAVLTSNVLYATIAQALNVPVILLNKEKSVNIPRIIRDLKAT